MKLSNSGKIIVFCLLLMVCLYFLNQKKQVVIQEIATSQMEDFDIILSKGQSVQSKLISLLKLTPEDYTHVGIIIKVQGKVSILHATPDGTQTNGIRYDDLQTFINIGNISDFTVLRYRNISVGCLQSLRKAFSSYQTLRAPFDYAFDNLENRKIYCSELVWLIFKNAGLFTPKDFNLQKPIYPNYFLILPSLTKVNVKKTNPKSD